VSGNPHEETTGQKVGLTLFGLAIVFCSMEMVPGWGVLHLGWPPETYYAIMATVGALAGVLSAAQHRLAGLLGGLVAGPGSLGTIAFVLERTTSTHTLILVIVGALGAVPGLVLYRIVASVQDSLQPSSEESHTAFDETLQSQPPGAASGPWTEEERR